MHRGCEGETKRGGGGGGGEESEEGRERRWNRGSN